MTQWTSKYATYKNSCNKFFSFLVLQQHANIKLMLCFLLFTQNLHAQNILSDSSTSRRIVVWDPLHWSDNTRGPLSKAFTNKQRKLRFTVLLNVICTEIVVDGDFLKSLNCTVRARKARIYPSRWILSTLLHFVRNVLFAQAGIHVVVNWEQVMINFTPKSFA